MAERWVYFFGDGSAEGDPDRRDILGGKGASLAAMTRAGLPVPPGFTISTECCRLFLKDGTWPEGLAEQVDDALGRLERATGRTFGSSQSPLLVSVRSGAAVSMPGMMDTILNCGLTAEMAAAGEKAFWPVYIQFISMFARTVADVEAGEFEAARAKLLDTRKLKAGHLTPADQEAIAGEYKRVYAQRAGRQFPEDARRTLNECIEAVFRSWNNPRAVTYRRENDVRGADGTAVNVQAMFPSEVSGIVFTTNPNDLGADEMIIESSYGLGEAIVSGEVHPDNFVVDRKDLTLKRSRVSRKSAVVAALGGAAPGEADALSLTQPQINALAEMSRRVEALFGHPVDVEWGLAEGRLTLLQARAIRGLDVAEDVEIGRKEEIYRLREITGDSHRVWVRHNLGETLAAPTPLTWDIVRGFMSGDGGFGRMYRDFGYRPSAEVCRDGFLDLICGRIYADPRRAADLFWDGMPLTYDPTALAADPGLIEAAPTKFEPEKATGRFLIALPGLVIAMICSSRRMKRLRATVVQNFEREILPAYLEYLARKRRQDLASLSTGDLISELDERVARILNGFGCESLKLGFFGGMAQAALEGRLRQLMGDEAGTELTLTLTQGLEGDTTVEQSVRLHRTARGEETLEGFLADYGHRAVGEMELSRPRWREDDSYVRQILGVYLDPASPSPEDLHEANVARRREAEDKLPATLRHWGGSSFAEEVAADLADAQAMLPYRESGRNYLMMGYELIRLAILELGRRWNLGRDVFFLRLEELGGYEARAAELAETIDSRRVRWLSARRLEMPDVIDSAELSDLGLAREYEAATELTGEPIASGMAVGAARIVFDPAQAASVRTDYILVCPSTDPAWTALFVHARGLVVEQGGILSHGAIVARDFGIPAVVCPDATRRIPDGATVRVDGNRGRISLL
jgi:phosphohistidine swiveling domain-containing protein